MAIYIEGKSDIGYQCLLNQDYILSETLSDDKYFKDDYLLGVIDGNGAAFFPNQNPNMVIQPSKIVANTIRNILKHAYTNHKGAFIEDPIPFMEMALIAANTAIGAAKMTHEELYGSFSACCTIAFVHENKITGIHCGNTRAYILKENKKTKEPQLLQLTKDQTVAQEMFDAGKITDIYSSPDIFTLTSGLGIFADPKVKSFKYPLNDNELLLLATDGLFYALSSETIIEHILTHKTTAEAIDAMVKQVKEFKHVDNIGMIIAFPVADDVLEESRRKNNFYDEVKTDATTGNE